jgi:hypothetical protein
MFIQFLGKRYMLLLFSDIYRSGVIVSKGLVMLKWNQAHTFFGNKAYNSTAADNMLK